MYYKYSVKKYLYFKYFFVKSICILNIFQKCFIHVCVEGSAVRIKSCKLRSLPMRTYLAFSTPFKASFRIDMLMVKHQYLTAALLVLGATAFTQDNEIQRSQHFSRGLRFAPVPGINLVSPCQWDINISHNPYRIPARLAEVTCRGVQRPNCNANPLFKVIIWASCARPNAEAKLAIANLKIASS